MKEFVADIEDKIRHKGLSHVLTRVICKPIEEILLVLFRLLPIKKNYIVLRSGGNFDDSSRTFYEYMIKNGYNKKYKIIWNVFEQRDYKKCDNVVFLIRNYSGVRFRYTYYNAVSKFVIYTHMGKKDVSWRKDQIFIHTTHSVDQLKAHTSNIVSKYMSYVLCSSEFVANRRKSYRINSEMLVLGLPRIDLLYQHKDCYTPIFGEIKKGKLILVMETFKQNKDRSAWKDGVAPNNFALNVISRLEQMISLDNFLEEKGCKMIVKIHLLQDLSYLETLGYEFKNIKYLTNAQLENYDIQVNELLENADLLITDYSSVFYEFLILNRPIGFTIGDIDYYTRGFENSNIENEMPGSKIKTFNDLLSFIESSLKGEDSYEAERKAILISRFKYLDNKNCERLYNWIDTH